MVLVAVLAGCGKEDGRASPTGGVQKGRGENPAAPRSPCGVLDSTAIAGFIGDKARESVHDQQIGPARRCEWTNSSPGDLHKAGTLSLSLQQGSDQVTAEKLYDSFQETSCDHQVDSSSGKGCWSVAGNAITAYLLRNDTFGTARYAPYDSTRAQGQEGVAAASRLVTAALRGI